ncbi:hydantoinase/oxoprolinase N-terminal domain-containing protein, partial [Rhodothermus marinus]|uniref:hydantoinase/oxoprolinase N-terminal domain-containing protein n=1 Tax=Rhodothermus marinus TaxID=29549 RepID=UPI0023428BA3
MSIRVGIDIGGTFTDFVVFDEAEGRLTTFKVFSTPDDPARAVLEGLQQVPAAARQIVHGSTVTTNALLERKGARTAFVTTAGFRDLLHIGRQNRAELYDLAARRPEPLVPRTLCFEVPERVGPDGSVLQPLDETAIPPLIEALRSARVESVAVCLLFFFCPPGPRATAGARTAGSRLRGGGLQRHPARLPGVRAGQHHDGQRLRGPRAGSLPRPPRSR